MQVNEACESMQPMQVIHAMQEMQARQRDLCDAGGLQSEIDACDTIEVCNAMMETMQVELWRSWDNSIVLSLSFIPTAAVCCSSGQLFKTYHGISQLHKALHTTDNGERR